MDETGEIEQDIRNWSKHVLEIPNPYLPNNLPACPYAKRAWADNKVRVIETDTIMSAVTKEIREFHDHDFDLTIVASYKLPPAEMFWEITEILNDIHAADDIHVMVFHPDYGAEEADLDFLYDHEWESGIERDYCMAFIQRLSQVDEASRHLEKLGYYEAFSEKDYQNLVTDRRRRLPNGHETKGNESR